MLTYFGSTPPPKNPQKSIFLTAQAKVPVCFDISRYLTDKYFVIVWRHHPPVTSQQSIFLMVQAKVPVCFDIIRYFDIL